MEKRAVIDSTKCDKSPNCRAKKTCPAQAIEREGDNEPYYVNTLCQGCAVCINECPKLAITMV